MATALFISETYLKTITAISSNVDVKDLIPFVEQSQDIHIQDAIGSRLYTTLQTAISSNTLNSDQTELLNLIRPCLAYYAMHSALPFINFKIRNVGVVKQNGENTTNADLAEIKFLRNEVKDTAEYYLQRINTYLCNYGNRHPTYTSPDGKGIMPSANDYSCDLYLDDTYEKRSLNKIIGPDGGLS